MCGICGIYDPEGSGPSTEELLERMTGSMTHRGPDDAGIHLSPDRCLGLGFRRLAIVDLSPDANQPMPNETGDVWLVFNGEIYNHLALRSELESAGHRFRSRTDGEVIVHGFEEWGEEVVHRLRGMFAFAVHHRPTGRLFLARDRIGVKPLYHFRRGPRFLFASEIKAILQDPTVPREVDEEALSHYLALAATPAPRTLFRGVRKLPPGHTLTVHRDGREELRRYWDPLDGRTELEGMPEEEIVERLRELLRESIRLRMMSDVPFGVFLSGGLDSSLNVALMSEMMERPVDTFSVAIRDDPASDERTEARRVARHFGARHHEVVIGREDFAERLPALVEHQDEPLSDPVCVPLSFVAELARENGTVVIQVGEGSDELFAGYPLYALMEKLHRRAWAPFARLPGWVKRPASAVGGRLLPPRRAELVRRAAEGNEMFWGGAQVFPEVAKRRLMRGTDGRSGGALDSHPVVAEHYARVDRFWPGASYLDRMIYLELKHRLPELLLMRVDKMTMAHSVEARVPYLDQELVSFALSIPWELKFRGGETKHILRRAARGIVPDHVIDRPKVGFCGGPANMVSGPLVQHARERVLGSEWIREWADPGFIAALFDEHESGRRDHGMEIWNLLTLTLWHRHWFEGAAVT